MEISENNDTIFKEEIDNIKKKNIFVEKLNNI